MTMLKKLPEEVLNLWNNWEIRGMVLLSLLLQTILIIFGSRRKTTGRIWIRILVWSAYLSADMVATVALGNLARSQGDSSGDSSEKANNSIQTFWAPFLLLHLGGPDTITAYSIEDNELWLRHLLGLGVQVGVAFYVFSRSWGSGILTFIAIPMFIVGIVKYAERTWVLRSSCSKSLKNSTLSDFWDSYSHTRISETRLQDLQGNYLLQAYIFSYISKFMMQDLVPDILSLIRSRGLISKNKADGAFKVVEVELGLIYDMLYTKAPLIYSRFGIILRSISFLLSITAFITFQVKIGKDAYSETDIAITYLLFAAAVFLEFYAFLCLVLSDWTMIWLILKGGNALTSAIYSQLRKLTRSERWSRSISQYNLISSSIENKPHKCFESLGIDEMMRQMHVNRKDLNVGLQGLIFKHLLKKAQKIKEDFNVFDKNLRSKIIGQRGDGVLEGEEYKWCTTEVEFSRSILVWHLATEICYLGDKDGSNVSSEFVINGRYLSEYMMYLLVIRPNMLSKGFGDEEYLETLRELRGFGNVDLILGRYNESRGYDDIAFQRRWKTEKSVLIGVEKLARQLRSLELKKRWEMINEVWVEMVAYAAAHCPWKEHTQQLRRGGELLTHVSLLMLHLGLSEQYEYKGSDDLPILTRLTGEKRQEYLKGPGLDKEERQEYLQAKKNTIRVLQPCQGRVPMSISFLLFSISSLLCTHGSFFKGSSRELVSTVEEKMTMLKKLPEEVLNLWNNWEIRGMVLLSLLLQTILIVFGPRRKTIGRIWIRILVWSAYLSADMVATVALGNLARSQGDSSGDSSEKANNSIQTFWAPFLLLHLGGPDTITAYSIEDNELWLRHLLGLVVQVGVALYVFSRSWPSGILTFIAIPMFIAGVVKYAERTWVLWSSCSKSLKNSSLSDFWRRSIDLRITEIAGNQDDLQREYLRQACTFFYISKYMMQDLVTSTIDLMLSQLLISRISVDGAFKVVEVELGLISDMLYTKAPLIYSRAGIVLRSISFLLSVSAFIAFLKIGKHAYSMTDITITYLLFGAAVFLELYAFLCLVLSDWTMIWLIDKGGNALTTAIYSQLRKLTRSERWSRSISQYNLISSSFEREPHRCLEFLGIDDMMRQMHVNRKDLNGELQGLIFGHLREKARKIKEDLNVVDKNVRSKIIGQRGDGVLEREGLLRDYKWCTTEVEFSRSILVWYLATDICYRADKDGSNVSTEDGRCLSEYMMYLLVIRPNMLSKGFGDDEEYQETLRDLLGLKDGELRGRKYQRTLRELWGLKDRGPDDEGYQRTLRELRNSESRGYDDGGSQFIWKTEKSVLRGVDRLARQLLLMAPEKRWEMINEVWVEMVAYAAAHCPWKEHTQQLRRGGELLTHVSLLMLHLGLSEQYEYKRSLYSYLKGEEREECFGAIDKCLKGTTIMSRPSPDEEEKEEEYLKGSTAMSGWSTDEEFKELEKIAADYTRELERKKRELEREERELEREERELELLRLF